MQAADTAASTDLSSVIFAACRHNLWESAQSAVPPIAASPLQRFSRRKNIPRNLAPNFRLYIREMPEMKSDDEIKEGETTKRKLIMRKSHIGKKTPRVGAAMMLAIGLATCALAQSSTVRAQTAVDSFDPNADFQINAMVQQPDGKVIIGGEFTTLAPNGGPTVQQLRIARLNPDGTLDTAFAAGALGANGDVHTIALQADGKIIVGGEFTGIGGEARYHIARLDPVTGAADSSFTSYANDIVYAVAVQADGKILIAGQFTIVGVVPVQQARNRLARLDPANGAPDSFDPNLSSIAFCLALQADSKILVGGQFTTVGGGVMRNGIARLDPITGAADSFDPQATAGDIVRSIAVQPDGKIIAGGGFGIIGGQIRSDIARLDPVTGAADSFDPEAHGEVRTIALQADGRILAGGLFHGANSIGGQTRNYVARLDPGTGTADSFDPNASDFVQSIAVQPDGKILLGGRFTMLAPDGGPAVTRNHIARVTTVAEPTPTPTVTPTATPTSTPCTGRCTPTPRPRPTPRLRP
jgi:uncharacterized delta-60 repeat protein